MTGRIAAQTPPTNPIGGTAAGGTAAGGTAAANSFKSATNASNISGGSPTGKSAIPATVKDRHLSNTFEESASHIKDHAMARPNRAGSKESVSNVLYEGSESRKSHKKPKMIVKICKFALNVSKNVGAYIFFDPDAFTKYRDRANVRFDQKRSKKEETKELDDIVAKKLSKAIDAKVDERFEELKAKKTDGDDGTQGKIRGSRDKSRFDHMTRPGDSAGATPSGSGSPAGATPAGSGPAGATPAGPGSPAGATPAGSGSPAGATPARSGGSPAGATPSGSGGSPAGATPSGSGGSPAGATPAGSGGSPAGATPAGSGKRQPKRPAPPPPKMPPQGGVGGAPQPQAPLGGGATPQPQVPLGGGTPQRTGGAP